MSYTCTEFWRRSVINILRISLVFYELIFFPFLQIKKKLFLTILLAAFPPLSTNIFTTDTIHLCYVYYYV